jgi:hypothetical protein
MVVFCFLDGGILFFAPPVAGSQNKTTPQSRKSAATLFSDGRIVLMNCNV